MNPALINVLLHAISYAPSIIEELESIMTQNWNHPVVQNAVQALNDVNAVVQRASAAQTPPPPPEPAALGSVPGATQA